MITEMILFFLTTIIKPIINLIPQMDGLVIPDEIMNYLLSIFRSIGFFIPVAELLPLLIFSIAVISWRFIYNLICRVRFFI